MGKWCLQLWTEITTTIYKNLLPFFNSKSILLLFIVLYLFLIVVAVPLNNHHFYKYFRFIILTSSLHRIASHHFAKHSPHTFLLCQFLVISIRINVLVKSEQKKKPNKQTNKPELKTVFLIMGPSNFLPKRRREKKTITQIQNIIKLN